MSIRFSGNKQHLIRTTSLPSAASAFTICGYAKLATAQAANYAVLAFLSNAGNARAHQAVVEGGSGTALRAVNDWGASESATVATLTAGGASGANWFFFALVGTASGTGGLRIYHRPVGGSLSVQTTDNSNFGGTAPAILRMGDSPLIGPQFGFTNFFFDGFLSHLKVYNAALSQDDIEQESIFGAPVRGSGLLSYHSFVNTVLADAMAPEQGSGAFTYPENAPAISSDNPSLPLPGVRVSWIEMDVPFSIATINANGVASRAAIGQPAVSIVGAASTVRVSWVEMELPPPAAATQLTSVASRAAVGLPEVNRNVLLTGVGSRAAIGQPRVTEGAQTGLTGVASVAAVGEPAVSGIGEINGSGSLTIEQSQTVNVLGVQTRRAVGTPFTTYTGTATLTGVGSRAAIGTPVLTTGAQINLNNYGVISQRAVGTPTVQGTTPTQTIVATGVAPRRAVGQPSITALDQEGQQLGTSVGSGGPDDDDEGVGPHRVPKHLRRKKKAEDPATVEARQRVEEAAEAPVARKSIQPAAAPFPRPVEGGVLVTPAMLEQIKQEAAKAARLAMEARQLKEGRLVTAARDYAEQTAQARAARLADLAIQAAEEAEYEPAEREQVKTVEIEDPVTGKPIKATIKTKVVA